MWWQSLLTDMRRYILTVIFAATIIALYHFIDVRLFNLDLTRRTKEALFVIRNEPDIDKTVVLFNVGKLQPDQLQVKIDSLLLNEPKRIGINLCHWERIPHELIKKYKSDRRIIFANCANSEPGSLSQVINDENTVTHFKADKSDYFESQLTDFKGRGNNVERINYGSKLDFPVNKGELADSYFWFDPEYLKEKTILIGYMGDYLTDSIYYFKNCRITPLNSSYGDSGLLPDMYDIEISANIMRTINENDFINEINQLVRVVIILAFSLLNVTILTISKTRWTIANLIIATLVFILLTGAGSFLLVYLFDKRYFLEMDELPLILLITTVFTVMLNISEKAASPLESQ
jgi:hypothetical protein